MEKTENKIHSQNEPFKKCKTYTTDMMKTGSTAATSNYTGAAY
jgi:hypothetical protein